MGRLTLYGLFFWLLTGVATCQTKVPDIPICVELVVDEKGYCAWTISEKEVVIDNKGTWLWTTDGKLGITKDAKPWKKIKDSGFILSTGAVAELKKYIQNSCKKHEDCNAGLGSWDKKEVKLSKPEGVVTELPNEGL